MKEAYKCKSADKARKRLQALVSWLERNGYDEAAGSLREGMEETLTVVKLALPELLRKSLATTNAIENLNGTIRRVSRNVKRWKSPSMIRRWTALGVVTAEKKFHVSKAIAIWALSFTRLEANRNLLTAMRLLPKSIHRCRRYPTKFNSGRDISYSKRSKVETTFHRYKAIVGSAMRARGLAAQRVEARIGCKILNTMTALGMPDSEMIG